MLPPPSLKKHRYTVKERMVQIAHAFIREKCDMSLAELGIAMGIHPTGFSLGSMKPALRRLLDTNILIHPKRPSDGKPMKRRYVLGLPEEEIDLTLSKLAEDGDWIGRRATEPEEPLTIKQTVMDNTTNESDLVEKAKEVLEKTVEGEKVKRIAEILGKIAMTESEYKKRIEGLKDEIKVIEEQEDGDFMNEQCHSYGRKIDYQI